MLVLVLLLLLLLSLLLLMLVLLLRLLLLSLLLVLVLLRQSNETDQAVTNLLGEVQKLEAKRASIRNVMAQTNKDLGHIKKATVTTEEQLHEKEELLEQVGDSSC